MRRLPYALALGLTLSGSFRLIAQQAPQGQNPPYSGQQDTASPARPPYAPDQQTSPSRPVPQLSGPPIVALEPTSASPVTARNQYGPPATIIKTDFLGSTYIPVDSWVYPAMLRLYSMGYVDTAFIGLRPWTRRSVLNMLAESEQDIAGGDNEEAKAILNSLLHELAPEINANHAASGVVYGLASVYTRFRGISGLPLRDSYHLGQSIVNDYGRPYQAGLNNITGFSTITEFGRFSLRVRGEYQYAPSGEGYGQALAAYLSIVPDQIEPYSGFNRPQDTIPEGPIASVKTFRLQEASIAVHLLNHEVSFGKSDAWLGPAYGGAFAWSNNAENIYAFRINRVEPLNIPLLSRLLGPVRYDFFLGPLQGHTYPNAPWAHSAAFSFRPTTNFEFGFQRTVIWGGKGHAPITLHTFLRSFFSTDDTTHDVKFSRNDPGARFSNFNFSWRLPFVRRYATLYVDSMVHDDVSPVSAPRRSAVRPGIYLSRFPGLPKLDLRVEAVNTDPPTRASLNFGHMYKETVQRQGYTNKGMIMGDWIGREAKGGQAWLTWHLSGNEWLQLQYLNKKNAKELGLDTTQNIFGVNVVKRFAQDYELNALVQHETWKAPIWKTGAQSDTTVQFQITWYPKLREGIR